MPTQAKTPRSGTGRLDGEANRNREYGDNGKAIVRGALTSLGGSIVYSNGYGTDEHYQLTVLGTLLTDLGVEAETLLGDYVEYLRNRFKQDPDLKQITSAEVSQALQLSDEQTQLLGLLLWMAPLFTSGGGYGPDGWSASAPFDIDEYPSLRDRSAIKVT
jgi:hypothetical protein